MRTKAVVGISLLAILPSPTAAQPPDRSATLVSPGSPEAAMGIRNRCPTFLWGSDGSTAAYELVVYELPREDSLVHAVDEAAAPALRIELPGAAPGWTPSLDRCLKRGHRYAWTLRALSEGKVSPWAQPHLFEVMPAPTADEVESALETIRLFLADGEDRTVDPALSGLEARLRELPAPPSAETAGRSPQGTGTAAILGEQPDPTGETYGVEGVNHSLEGAGLAAENTSGGADLRLRGDGSSAAARLTESTLDRPSGLDQTFDFVNSGGGAMTLQVAGADVVTTLTDQDSLGALSCVGTQIAKWDGAAWQCTEDENDDTLGGLACDPNQVAQWNGSAWICSDAGTDTLAGLACTSDQVVHWNGSAWVCGQPALTEVTCTGSPDCSAFCPTGSIVWTGGCTAFPGSASIRTSVPTSGGAGQPPTGWTCSAFNPLGAATVDVELYCVSQ